MMLAHRSAMSRITDRINFIKFEFLDYFMNKIRNLKIMMR